MIHTEFRKHELNDKRNEIKNFRQVEFEEKKWKKNKKARKFEQSSEYSEDLPFPYKNIFEESSNIISRSEYL